MIDVNVIETAKVWPVLHERLVNETDARKRGMIGEIVRHMVGEYCGDTPLIMDTLIAEPVFHYWGHARQKGPVGYDETFRNYQASEQANRNLVIERVLVDGDLVFTDGVLQIALTYDRAADMCGAEAAKGLDPAKHYLAEIRLGIVWPFAENGKIIGEDIYFATTAQVAGPCDPEKRLFPGPVVNKAA
ncbi:hypothetical protein ACFOD9_06630 [Novosphingobium bradum]|uniref:Nuclear transport factor 2 family protein n=1 Tax=Novosphingobium bradum TaxID=1737444 RepID=A0ABV7IRS8_9SPHN